MHPVTILVAATFVLLLAFLVWNLLSVKRHRFNRDRTGIGGSNDPLSGKTEGIRPPGEISASLNEASGRPPNDRG
jgi:hypothetical protein